jgi:hypothetical protein
MQMMPSRAGRQLKAMQSAALNSFNTITHVYLYKYFAGCFWCEKKIEN